MSGLPDCPKCGSKYVYEDGNMIVCPECAHEWTSGAEATSDSDVKIVKDSNGNVLSDGDSVTINSNEVPVFWPCGVTPQNAVMNSKPPIAITHAPGHMFITDVKNTSLKY